MTLPKPDNLGRELATTLQHNRIPPCPTILSTLSQEMAKESPDYRFLSGLLATDVGISAGLIKLANSPYFGARRRVSTVAESLMVLGIETVSHAVACISLHKAFPDLRHMERFWDASGKIANLAGWLARELECQGVRAQEAYTYGLFRDCGIAVLLQHFPDYAEILKRANHEAEKAFTMVEDEVLPTNHAVTGALMTQSWWLPDVLALAVRHHHDLTPLPPDESKAATLIALAQVAEYLLQDKTGLSHTEEWHKLGGLCQQTLGLTDEDLQRLQLGAATIISATTAQV